MNYWTELSIEYANQKSYLDDLFQVYPAIPEGIREMSQESWNRIEQAFKNRDNTSLIKELLQLDLFPIKDSYIAFLKRDSSSIERNPKTINRICGRLYDMGLDKIFEKCSEPKETNRQIGPFFRRWLNRKALGIQPIGLEEFTNSDEDAILNGSDQELAAFGSDVLNYKRDKGLDFVARFNKQYIIGESKFLTDFGGHQNAQFSDAVSTVQTKNVKTKKILILNTYLFSSNYSELHKDISEAYKDYITMSVLVLTTFLHKL
ncbi:MAG TPA: hypothetical protein PK239_03970 [Chitinophagales bacterium]|nr:hypothetical protein [Chitinophagales bacterium]